MNQTVFGKGLVVSIKGHLCLTKGHLDYPEGQVEVEIHLTGIVFDTFDLNQEIDLNQEKVF